jgi:hypothetical protein
VIVTVHDDSSSPDGAVHGTVAVIGELAAPPADGIETLIVDGTLATRSDAAAGRTAVAEPAPDAVPAPPPPFAAGMVKAALAADGSPRPWLLCAVTVQVYVAPAVSPVTAIGDDALVALCVAPPVLDTQVAV